MVRIIYKCLFLLGLSTFLSCDNASVPVNSGEINWDDSAYASIAVEHIPNLEIREGLISRNEQDVAVKDGDNTKAIIRLSSPTIVAQSDKIEEWGFFQFPIIYRAVEDGRLIIRWQMRADSHTAYGDDSFGYVMSVDDGASWQTIDKDYYHKERTRVELKTGDIIQVKDPASVDINSYNSFPNPVSDEPILGHKFYMESHLPDALRGVYFEKYDNKNRSFESFHASLADNKLLRYSINDLMPIVWWGDIKELNNGHIVAAVYGGYYPNSQGNVLRDGISFYESADNGKNWTLLSIIPYQENGDYESFVFDGKNGFTEPALEILHDGTYLVVMRNTNWYAPLCRSFSKDGGKNWSIPDFFTPNGVRPQMLTLGNGVLVLASGRPGLQVRFCLDGDGKNWTEPIDMMPFIDEKGNYKPTTETCGYPSLLKADDNSFYLVYSDFKTKNSEGEFRKSIVFRKIQVFKR